LNHIRHIRAFKFDAFQAFLGTQIYTEFLIVVFCVLLFILADSDLPNRPKYKNNFPLSQMLKAILVAVGGSLFV
jgi:hypothetical protein